MTSLRPIKSGEEVLNYYGALPSCDLLRRYGYTSEKHRRYDVVELPWDVVQKTINEKFSSEVTAKVDEDELEESFVLERESGDPDETGVNTFPARFNAFPEELEEQINLFTASALRIQLRKLDKVAKQTLRAAYADVIAKAMPARLKQYATTIPEDEALLESKTTTGRLRMAIEVRLGEKRLLQEAQVLANDLVAKYKQADAKSDEPKAKKQKTSR